jgi:hypothetical protein
MCACSEGLWCNACTKLGCSWVACFTIGKRICGPLSHDLVCVNEMNMTHHSSLAHGPDGWNGEQELLYVHQW